RVLSSGASLSQATMQQRLTAVRLYFDYLMQEQICSSNPVGRGRFTPGRMYGGRRARGLIPRQKKFPWIPTDDEWQRIASGALDGPPRNRLMWMLAYDAALRREELCSLQTADIDPSSRLVRIRAETTKGRARDRIIPFSPVTTELFRDYLVERRKIT